MLRGPIFIKLGDRDRGAVRRGGCAGTKEQADGHRRRGRRDGNGGAGRRGRGGRQRRCRGSGIGGFATTDGRVIGTDALGDAACAVATQSAQKVPLDLYIMLDSSGSMAGTVAGNQTKWDAVRGALTAFLRDPKSAGLGVGIQYFPLFQPGRPRHLRDRRPCVGYGPCDILRTCSGGTRSRRAPATATAGAWGCASALASAASSPGYCSPAGPRTAAARRRATMPADRRLLHRARTCATRPRTPTPAVEVATLPGAAPALISSLSQHMVDGLTPTAGALSGAIQHAQALARANPTHKLAVLLATDGLPSECTPVDIAGANGIAAIAAAAYRATPAVATYVIGVFTPEEQVDAQTNLDALAAAGGTGRAFVINTNQNVSQSFVDALNAVRSSGLSASTCSRPPCRTAGRSTISASTCSSRRAPATP